MPYGRMGFMVILFCFFHGAHARQKPQGRKHLEVPTVQRNTAYSRGSMD